MKSKASSEANAKEKYRTNEVTLKAYKDLAAKGSKHENLSEKQKAIIKKAGKGNGEERKRGLHTTPSKKKKDGPTSSDKFRCLERR